MYFTLIASPGTAQYGKREISRTRDDRKLCSKLFWEIELLSASALCASSPEKPTDLQQDILSKKTDFFSCQLHIPVLF